MSDVVKCKAVLKVDVAGVGSLYLTTNEENSDLRIIRVRPMGMPRQEECGPEWEYEVKGDVLHLQPSLLCTDTNFHTAYHWIVAFDRCADDVRGFDRFYELNPLK